MGFWEFSPQTIQELVCQMGFREAASARKESRMREARLEALVSTQQQKQENMEGSFALLRRGNMHRDTVKGTG